MEISSTFSQKYVCLLPLLWRTKRLHHKQKQIWGTCTVYILWAYSTIFICSKTPLFSLLALMPAYCLARNDSKNHDWNRARDRYYDSGKTSTLFVTCSRTGSLSGNKWWGCPLLSTWLWCIVLSPSSLLSFPTRLTVWLALYVHNRRPHVEWRSSGMSCNANVGAQDT